MRLFLSTKFSMDVRNVCGNMSLAGVGHRGTRGRASFEESAGSGTVGVRVERPGRKRRA